jgi:hypothetical protein
MPIPLPIELIQWAGNTLAVRLQRESLPRNLPTLYVSAGQKLGRCGNIGRQLTGTSLDQALRNLLGLLSAQPTFKEISRFGAPIGNHGNPMGSVAPRVLRTKAEGAPMSRRLLSQMLHPGGSHPAE